MKRLKRIVLLLCAAVLLTASLPMAASASVSNFKKVNTYQTGQFKDMPNDWSADGIRSTYELGLMKGTSANTFNPKGGVTLAETVAMASRLHRIYHHGSDDLVQGTPWYEVYVNYAKKNGILTQNYANYNAAATRAQFASILAHALPPSALTQINDVKDGAIPDVSASRTNAAEIYLLYRAGVLTGSDEKLSFKPSTGISRAEAATIITRMALPDHRVTLDLKDGNYTWQGDSSLDFTAQTTAGQSFTLSQQAGKVVLVNFWATWCGPCVGELPDIQKLYEEYGAGDEVVILTINAGESASTVKSFMSQMGYTFPVICDTTGTLSYAYSVNAIPRTVIFGKDGTVKSDLVGARNYQAFKSAITGALGS